MEARGRKLTDGSKDGVLAHHRPFPRSELALAALVLAAGLASGAAMLAQAQAPRSPTPEPVEGVVRVETVARGLEHPWALEFLPAGRLLVTERPARDQQEIRRGGNHVNAGGHMGSGINDNKRRLLLRGLVEDALDVRGNGFMGRCHIWTRPQRQGAPE
jgi:glucose/arabinose dehydrogenase